MKNFNKYIRRQEFFEEHPKCCFCGGEADVEEIDHIPARSLFIDRQWPEGYEFPTCIKCNRNSRHAENIIALISRLYPNTDKREGEKEIRKRFDSLERNYPGILNEMNPTVREKRNSIKKDGINVPYGVASSELPLLRVNGPRVTNAVQEFGRKLFLALYYYHTNSILPKTGGIEFKWFSNLQIENEVIPRELSGYIQNFSELKRNSKDLSKQFYYRYGVYDDGNKAIFLVFFHKSFAMFGFVQKNKFDFPPSAVILQPYDN